MKKLETVYVDFNNRLNLGDGEMYFRVSLRNITGMPLGTRFIADDHEDIQMEVELVEISESQKYAIAKVINDLR